MLTLMHRLRIPALVFTVGIFLCQATWGQTENASIRGTVTDASGAVIAKATVRLIDIDRGSKNEVVSDPSGFYNFFSVRPGRYRMEVEKNGFKTLHLVGITANVQDRLEENFRLDIGAVSESVTVEGGAPVVDTLDATVSTVVDRNFAENLPMNGRSFQTLIELTPGVVPTTGSLTDSGQFSVNGQRATSNYWSVDGVGANFGIGANTNGNPGEGLAGSVGSFSVFGGTNSLVSVDAMQEFRIQTSTYAPEFGRTPGAQISIVTRSGTNQFHGAVFDYLRNDLFDANDWFADKAGLPKPQERQNDFGGTFSGPLRRDSTFFFFSYEGLRLRLPQTNLTLVPDLQTRQNAIAAQQPYFNSLPLPNGPEVGGGIAQFNASYSNRASLDAYSLRVDQKLGDKITVFGRYNYSPSSIVARGFNGFPLLSVVTPQDITTQTATAGMTWLVSPQFTNDLRFNYSRANAFSYSYLDDFGGAVPLTASVFPSPYNNQDGNFGWCISALIGGNGNGCFNFGKNVRQIQRQINIVDGFSMQRGSHTLKVGIDYRRLLPVFDPPTYSQQVGFANLASAEAGDLSFAAIVASRGTTMHFQNLGIYGQDTWRIRPRLTLTYGLRWDVDFSPSADLPLAAVTGFDLNNISNLALAPSGTPLFSTSYGNVAPRLGLAYQLSEKQNRQTVIRGGFGVFYDLATQEIGNGLFSFVYPFGAVANQSGSFPLTPAQAAPPPITPNGGGFLAVDPNLKLPYTLQWNVSLEQALGTQQTVTASYIGATGRRLIQTMYLFGLNATFPSADLLMNSATSDYDALQVQYNRRLSRGLQALASYTWAHSIDSASSGSWGNSNNFLVPAAGKNSNRGPSDFDIRNAFSLALTYQIPNPNINQFTNAITRGWSLQSIIQARSAPPVTVQDADFFLFTGGVYATIRPDLVPGKPLYLYGTQYPGGRSLNPEAFTDPPVDPATGSPLRQGNVSRNSLRAFGLTQWDFAVHRDFPIRDPLTLQFRAEMFNVLNQPNFGPPNTLFGTTGFGTASQMFGQSLSGGGSTGNGGLSPLYSIGGPRSMQFALKLSF